jgi:hypothetical protein
MVICDDPTGVDQAGDESAIAPTPVDWHTTTS